MKKVLTLIILLLFILSCTGTDERGNKPSITLSIQPFKYFVEALVAENYIINVIVPSGASPATFDPPPSVIKGLAESNAVVFNGYLGYELAWKERLLSVNPDIDIIDLSINQDLIASESHRHGDYIHYTGVDPHYWISPKSAMRIAELLKDYFIRNNPDEKDVYLENYNQLNTRIISTDRYVDSLLNPVKGKSFMIFHPALSYLARDYGLEQIPVEAGGKEPSPSSLKLFIDRGRSEGIKVIFVQKEFDKRNAETIAAEIGAKVIVIDPLASDWDKAVREMAEALNEGINTNK